MKKNFLYFFGGLTVAIFANLWTLFHIDFGAWVLVPVWFFLEIIFSGSLLSAQMLNTKKLSFSEWIIYVSGFGLFQLIILGLILNTIGLTIHHSVLTTHIVIAVFDLLLIILSCLVVFRGRLSYLLPNLPKTSNLSKLFTLLPFLFPIVSVLGANRLNNGESGGVAIGLYLCMLIFVGLIITFKQLRSEQVFASALWGISFAILLSVSMRSNHLIGYDINQEFQVFSAALKDGLWHPHLFKNTYNACLSITILPAMLQVLMPISPEYLFKFVMQGIFCFAPIGVYVFAKYFIKKMKKDTIYAFIAALFFVIQYQFLNEFPGLIREQAATVFFALIFIAATNLNFSKQLKSTLILMFGLGMIVSHYSTAYICLGLLILMLIIKPILQRVSTHFAHSSVKRKEDLGWHISPLIVAIMFLFSFMWYAEISSSTGGITQKIGASISGLEKIFSSNSRSPFVNATLGINSSPETQQLLKEASSAKNPNGSYTDSSIADNEVFPASVPSPQVNNNYQSFLLKTINRYVPALVKLLVVVGLSVVIIRSLQRKRALEDGALVIAGGIIFTLMIILPSLSQSYNLERLYQQLLVLFSAGFVIGGIVIMRYIEAQYTKACIAVLLAAYFLCTSGVALQLAFGMSNINFDNHDLNYVHFYSTDGDINSLTWLERSYQQKPDIVSIDNYSLLKTYSHTNLPSYNLVPGLLPSQMYQSAYVYASSTNLNKNIVFDSYNGQTLTYTFPRSFLDNNKSVIYSNGDSIVYK